MPETILQHSVVQGSGFARLVPVTLAADKKTITAFGSKIDVLTVTGETISMPSLAPKIEEKTQTLSTGNVIAVQLATKKYSATTGEVISEGAEYKIEFKATLMAKFASQIFSSSGSPFAVMIGNGYNALGQHLGVSYIIGYLDATNYETKGEFSEITLSFKGAELIAGGEIDYTDFNTAMTGTIQAVGMGAQSPVAITSTDFTDLLAGKIVSKWENVS